MPPPTSHSPYSAVSVLLVIENSVKIAKDWLNLRDRYIRTTIDSLKASNASLPMNIMVLPSLPPQTKEPSWNLPQRYSDLEEFQFNPHPSNRLSAGHIYSGIQFLSSCQNANFSSVERHIFIIAATTPSESISGVDCEGLPVWSFLAKKLHETNIYCHLIVSSIEDVSPFSRLYEETLHLQGNIEHSFQVMPWFASNSQTYSLRLATQRPPQNVSSPATPTSGPRAPELEHDPSTPASTSHGITKPNVPPPGPASQYTHVPSKKKMGSSLRSGKEDPSPQITDKVQGGKVTPPYRVERTSRTAGAVTRSSGDSRSYTRNGETVCHISSFTPGVTTLLPVPPAPVVTRSGANMQAQTLLPIPPAPSTSRPVVTQTLLPVPPAPNSTPSSPRVDRLRSQNLYTKEFIAHSAAGMSAVLPVPPPPPVQNHATVLDTDQNSKRPAPLQVHPPFLEDPALIIDAFLDPNHHFTLDFFQTNLIPMLDAQSNPPKSTLKDPSDPRKSSSSSSLGNLQGDGESFHLEPSQSERSEYTDPYLVSGYDANIPFLPHPNTPFTFSGGDMLASSHSDGLEARSTRSLSSPILAGNYVALSPSPSLAVEVDSVQGTPKAISGSLSSLQGWAG